MMQKNETLTLPDYRKDLQDLFEDCFVVSDFMYKGICLDYAVIAKDMLIEVCYVETKDEYSNELATIGRAGKFSFKKHKSIQDGKFISNAFYFLCPSRVLLADELPPKYGLITITGGKLSLRKEAYFIDPSAYLQKSFYATLSKKLAQQLYSK